MCFCVFFLTFPMTLPRMHVFYVFLCFFFSIYESPSFCPICATIYTKSIYYCVSCVFVFFLKVKKNCLYVFYVFLRFFWVTNFRPGYKTHVFYVFLCFFQSTKKWLRHVFCVFLCFFWTVDFRLWFCVFFSPINVKNCPGMCFCVFFLNCWLFELAIVALILY